ncbi:NADH-quinone oxidoreductase subunit C [Hamadaea tsunoensis]|uniref:NADH-quinone oxidoreductase subunit C n=1 Tax=Hamadaea tsunoensis TaxID=53368 RepID=UPI00041C715B|nr:NADH-quinone oxidoreductase subunit C [Hamadaea tsunoensis]
MTPEEVGARLTELLAAAGVADGVTAGVSAGNAYARAVVDVPADSWPAALTVARDRLGCDFFDWLSAVDELPEGFAVLAHLWSTAERFGVLVRTRLGRSEPSLPSVVDVYPGAAWHERETFEMFGIGFPGELPPLLLPPEFEGHPLRKEFILASRVAKPWPGAKEPGESESGSAKRAPVRPPGVPSPEEWGPAAHRAATAPEAAPGAED